MQVNRPLPFKVRFIPRSTGVLIIIQKDAESATILLRKYDGESKVTMENAKAVDLGAAAPAIQKA